MATRKNTFLLKRSNVTGNVPTAGQILLGELALNTSDVKLYASGTTTNSIIQIGWDRISRTGDTMTGTLYAPTISATTYQNLPTDVRVTGGTYINSTGTATYTNNTGGTFSVTGFTTGSTTLDNRLLLTDSSTGLLTFDGISATSGGTTFNVGAIKAWFIDNYTDPINPVKQYVELSAQTGIPVTNISGHSVTYIAVDSGGTIYQQATVFHPSTQRYLISLGVIVHTNRIFVNTVNNQPVVASAPLSQFSDLIEAIGFFNINGNLFSPNGVNLNINKSSGDVFKQGVNFMNDNKNPHTLFLSGLTAPTNIRYRLQTGIEYANTAVIDPGFYDLNGVLTPVTGSKYTIQRINVFQSNLVRIQYGQKTYPNLADAIQGISTEPFVVEDNIQDNGLFRCLLLVKATTTDLSNTADALFIEAGKFGNTAGLGSLSTTTLQQAYNNSTAPEIVTNSILGGLSIQNGTGNANNVTNLLEGINSTGSITSFVRADGYISGTTFQTNGFNANSNGVTATTVTATTMSAVTFTGNLTGTASLATSATTALNATNVGVTNNTTTNAIYYPTFVSATSGNLPLQVDSATLTFNPSTDTLTVANISGLASLATSATTALNSTQLNGQLASFYYPASNPNGYTTNTGTVTQVNSGNGMNFTNFTTSGTITMGTPSSTTLASTNATTTNSHTHAFAPGGTVSQYITGAGTLVTFPTITTVNDGTLTLATSGIATGSASFTANQAGGSTFTVAVPATDLSIGSNTGTVVRVDSSTGTDATLPVATASLAGVVTNTTQTFAGVKTFNDNVNMANTADLKFVDLAGTFPTSGKGFDWELNNDGARIYAIQPISDSIDLVFQLRDNATTNDRFVFHVDDYQGPAFDKYPLIIRGGTEFDLVDSALYTNGTVRLSNAGVLQNVTGNISMFTNDSGYLLSSRTLSINGTTYDLTANRSWVVPTVTANTFNNATYDLTISTSNGINYTSNLGLLATDVKVTGGTYNINTGVVTFTNTTGGTFNVTGFTSGMTDTFVTGGTYAGGTATFTRSNGAAFNVTGFNTGSVTGVNSGNGMNFTNFTTSGTITMGTPSSTTLSSTNATTTNSHTHAFAPGGTASQYITGAGTLVTFPTIPTVNDGTLTLATSGIATGSATFTANQAGGSTFTVAVPATDLSIGVSSGTQVRVDSSTGADVNIPVASATLAGIVTTGAQTFAGIKTFSSTISGSINGNAATADNATSADKIDNINFRNSDQTSPITAPDTLDSNGVGYVTNINLYGQIDGALYAQAYSSAWQHQIFGDYRTGQLAVRGKNSGTWQSWRNILDSTNFTNYAVPTSRTLTINGTTYDLSANRSWTVSGSGGVTGGGTVNYLAKFTGSTGVGDSLISDNGSMVTVYSPLTVNGDAFINGLTVGLGGGNVNGNSVLGNGALSSNASGSVNIAIGNGSLASSDSSHNLAIGFDSAKYLSNGSHNTIIGNINNLLPDSNQLTSQQYTLSISKDNALSNGYPQIWSPEEIIVKTGSGREILTVSPVVYSGIFIEYVLEDEIGNMRGGTMKGIFNSNMSSIKWDENSTMDIGSTVDYVFDFIDNGAGGLNVSLINNSVSYRVYCNYTSRLILRRT